MGASRWTVTIDMAIITMIMNMMTNLDQIMGKKKTPRGRLTLGAGSTPTYARPKSTAILKTGRPWR